MENNAQPADLSAAVEEKKQLVSLLDRSRRTAIEALRGISDQAIVYPESGWRVQDVLGHLAAWEREILASLEAYAEGDEYSLGEEHVLDIYNEENYLKRREYAAAQCRTDWAMVRRELQYAVSQLDAGQLDGHLCYPWGTHGTVTQLIDEVVQHEEEHLQEILDAVGAR